MCAFIDMLSQLDRRARMTSWRLVRTTRLLPTSDAEVITLLDAAARRVARDAAMRRVSDCGVDTEHPPAGADAAGDPEICAPPSGAHLA